MSTRYHSSGSICPRPSFCVSLSLSLSLSPSFSLSLFYGLVISVALVISIRPVLSPSFLCRSRFFSVPRFVPDTQRAGPLRFPLSSPPPSPRLVLSRQPHRFTFCVPPAVSLAPSRSHSLSTFLYGVPAYQSVSVPRAPYLLSRTGSPVLALAVGALLRGALLSLFLPLWHR